MRLSALVVCTSLGLATVACSSPVKPAGGVSVTAGLPISPANGALIADKAQPLILSVRNGLVTGSVAIDYVFQVATDPSFNNTIQTKEAAQTPDQTSVRLDVLTPGRTYYWRVRTVAADTTGEFTGALAFTIGPVN